MNGEWVCDDLIYATNGKLFIPSQEGRQRVTLRQSLLGWVSLKRITERTRACVATGDTMKNCSWYSIKNYFRSKIELR
jgi:hypothetical protein